MLLKVKEPQAEEVSLLRPGQVVFTYLHLAPNPELTRELVASGAICIAYETVEDDRGWREAVRPTGFHKFYREGDRAWVSAEDLRPGDGLRGRGGPLTVVANRRLPGVERVYNLTVEGEHVYRVGELGTLVHNMDCTKSGPKA